MTPVYCMTSAYGFAMLLHLSATLDIVGIFPTTNEDEHTFHEAIMKTLATAGHKISVIGYYQFSAIDTVMLYRHPADVKMNNPVSGFLSYLSNIILHDTEYDTCHAVLNHPYIWSLLHFEVKKPDLIIAEVYRLPCFALIAEHFNIPYIGLVSGRNTLHGDYNIGCPNYPSYIPTFLSGSTQRMKFQERLLNFIQSTAIYIYHYSVNEDKLRHLYEMYVSNRTMVPVTKLYQNHNLIFYNNHFTFINRPLTPNAIEVAGIHVKRAKPISQDLLKFIEEAENGVIFINLNRFDYFIEQKFVQVFQQVFSVIPQRVIWQNSQNNFTIHSWPKNVVTNKEFSPRDIIDHKNVRAIICHGSLPEIYESMHTGTPVIGIPITADQVGNVKILEEKEAAVLLNYQSITAENLQISIATAIRYLENMRKISDVFRDRPMNSSRQIVYWTEYIVRHKGAPFLRIVSADMPLYQYLLLDVLAVLFISIFLLVGVAYIIIRVIFRLFSERESTSVKEKLN